MSSKKIFVNLPVKNLDKSMQFFRSLGYDFNLQFTDETAACMVISEDIYVMLLTEPKFQTFIPAGNAIGDAKKSTEVLVCLSLDSRPQVDEIVAKAVAGGGKTFTEPIDYGFMYSHSMQDLDGHVWEFIYMDPSHVQK